MDAVAALLEERLLKSERLCVLGAGASSNGDDAAGPLVAARLRRRLAGRSAVLVIDGGTAPENFTGEIRRFAPDRLVIVDAADTGSAPGTIAVVPEEKLAGAPFGTHQMPLSFLVSFLRSETGCAVTLVGIQPERVDYGAPRSRAVARSVRLLAAVLYRLIRRMSRN